MEKDILIQNLKTKLGEDTASVISEKTFGGIAELYLSQFADDSAITDETWVQPLAILKEYAGQKRHDDKLFAEKFKADYAKEFASQHEKDVEERIKVATEKALEEYKKTLEPPKKEGSADEDLDKKVGEAVAAAIAGLTGDDGAIGKLTKTVDDFTKTFKAQEKTASEKKLRSELTAYLKERKADKEAVVELTVSQIEIGENPDMAELKVLAEKNYESNYKKFYGDGTPPFGGGGGGGGDTFVTARLKRLEEEAKESADYAASIEKTFQ